MRSTCPTPARSWSRMERPPSAEARRVTQTLHPPPGAVGRNELEWTTSATSRNTGCSRWTLRLLLADLVETALTHDCCLGRISAAGQPGSRRRVDGSHSRIAVGTGAVPALLLVPRSDRAATCRAEAKGAGRPAVGAHPPVRIVAAAAVRLRSARAGLRSRCCRGAGRRERDLGCEGPDLPDIAAGHARS